MNKNSKFDVIVCGSLHLDIVVHADGLPRIDETVVGHKWEQICGGKGGNQAVQAARHGAKTAMISRIGLDRFGETLLHNLKAADVDTQLVEADSTLGTGMSVAILQGDGEYGAVIVSGSNLNMDANSLAQNWKMLGGAKVLVLQNEVSPLVNIAAAQCARDHNAIVLLNAAPAREITRDLHDNVDVLIVNRVEAEMMSGIVVTDRLTAKDALSKLSTGKNSVVVTLGGKGLVVKEKNNSPIEIEALAVKVTSTHGAGDSFVGALAASLASGEDLVTSCRWANDKAAAFVSRL